MHSTTISLLTNEGAASFTFSPALTAEQYTELSALIANVGREENMHLAIQAWAAEIGLALEIDGKVATLQPLPVR